LFRFVLRMRSKALLLLLIFLANTVAGFGCALRMSHEEHNEAAEHHDHHHSAAVSVDYHSTPSEATVASNDFCCQGAVNNFISLAKLVPPSGHVLPQASFAYIHTWFQFALAPLPDIKAVREIAIDERQRPPTGNIRIAIRSLLI
jgi:hypothetical protein